MRKIKIKHLEVTNVLLLKAVEMKALLGIYDPKVKDLQNIQNFKDILPLKSLKAFIVGILIIHKIKSL